MITVESVTGGVRLRRNRTSFIIAQDELERIWKALQEADLHAYAAAWDAHAQSDRAELERFAAEWDAMAAASGNPAARSDAV